MSLSIEKSIILFLNIEKSIILFIIFRNRGKIIGDVGGVLMNGCKISKVYNANFLGMIIDSNLTWKYHIVPRLTHSEPLFVKLGILTVDRIFKYNIGLLMYKYHHSMLPPVLDMFVKICQDHSYNTRQSDLLHVHQCRTELGKMSFKYQAVMVWNHIYLSVDVYISIGTFKCHLKSHLFSIMSWIIIVSTVCVFPLYVFRIYWPTRHDSITGAPYMHFLCTLTLAPCIEYVYQLWGHINIIVSAPFVSVSVLCCICIVYCKVYCGNKLLFCSVHQFLEILRRTCHI